MSRRRSSSRIAASAGGVAVLADAAAAWRVGADVVVAGELAHADTRQTTASRTSARELPLRAPLAPTLPRTLLMRLDGRRDDGLDPTANVEVTRHLHPSWFA